MSANLKDTITHYYKDRIHPAMITVWVKDSGPDAVWSFIQTDDVESWKRFEFYLKELQAPNIAISGLFVLLAGKFPSAPLGKIGPYGFYLIRYPRPESRQARRFEERNRIKAGVSETRRLIAEQRRAEYSNSLSQFLSTILSYGPAK